MAKRKTLDEAELQSIAEREIRASSAWLGSEIANDQTKALDYYLGKPLGNEIEGRSQVISMDVQDTIESVLPDLLEIFEGGDEVVKFEPRGQEDEELAKQATEYVGYVWRVDNDGFWNSYCWIKDALIQKVGVLKSWWDDTPEYSRETLRAVNRMRLEEFLGDPEIELEDVVEREPTEEEMPYSDGVMYDLTVCRTTANGRVRIQPVAPENFGISSRAIGIDDARALWHREKKSVSDLIEDGFDRDKVESLASFGEGDITQGQISRFGEEEFAFMGEQERSGRDIWVYDLYVQVDIDGDGIAEWCQIVVAGPGYTLLDWNEVDGHPFTAITPIPTPHKFFGRSYADLTMDVQLVKSTVLRQVQDNMYLQNNGRALISESVNLDDWLLNRPGGAVRVKGPTTQGQYEPIITTPLMQQGLQVLEYWDHIRGQRSGETGYSQGLDSEALNKTASGMNMILGQSQRRKMMVARCMAEMGYAKIFRRILKLVVNNQDRARTIRLRNNWVPVDPRSWKTDMDVSVTVGLGRGSQQEQLQRANLVLSIQEKALQYQKGLGGPFVGPDELHNGLATLVTAMGYKHPGKFFKDPQGKMPEPQPSPEEIKLQLEDKQKSQEQQIKREDNLLTDKRERVKIALDYMLKLMELQIEDAHLRMQHDFGVAQAMAGTDAEDRDFDLRKTETMTNAALKSHEIDSRTQQEKRT